MVEIFQYKVAQVFPLIPGKQKEKRRRRADNKLGNKRTGTTGFV